MSVSRTNFFPALPAGRLSDMRPIDMPATGALIGTPASISASVEPQVEAIEVDPLLLIISDTSRIVYGNVSSSGITDISARSASAPWPISRRLGVPILPVSPPGYGGML